MKSLPDDPKSRRSATLVGIAFAALLWHCDTADARPAPVIPEAHEVALAMHWLTLVVPPPPPSTPSPPFPSPLPVPQPPVPSTCLPTNPNCNVVTPPPPTIDQHYREGFVPRDVSTVLAAELPRLVSLLPATSAAKLHGWTVSIDNCGTTAPFILVCKDSASRVIRIAPILVAAIFGKDPRSLVEVQQKLQEFGADPGSFDGSYQPVYAAHGLSETDWKANLKSFAARVWTPLVSSVDYVIAQEMATLYLSSGAALPASDPAVNQEAERLSTPPNWFYDPSGLVTALTQAAFKYDSSTWGYEQAGDGGAILGGIPPGQAP